MCWFRYVCRWREKWRLISVDVFTVCMLYDVLHLIYVNSLIPDVLLKLMFSWRIENVGNFVGNLS